MKKPILILTCGLMGTGKSTLAEGISERLGIELLRSDLVRKEIAGLESMEHRYEEFGGGIYSEAFFDATYEALFRRGEEILKGGKSVIMDASFKKRRYRGMARAAAGSSNASFILVECTCSEGEVRRRLDERFRDDRDASDGRWEIYKDQKADFEAVDELPEKEHLILNTEELPEKNLDLVVDIIGRLQSRLT